MPRIISLDADLCLYNEHYFLDPESDKRRVIRANQPLLKFILAEKSDKLILMLGSLRQSNELDKLNSRLNDTESAFIAIQTISEHLNARLDPFLMADVSAGVPPGTAYWKAMDRWYVGAHPAWVEVDETKITLLYAQIQKAAFDYPDETILFDFFDDRSNEFETHEASSPPAILEHLKCYFNAYPNMIPSHVTLRLHHYDGGTPTLLFSVQGTGTIDALYNETVKEMMCLILSTTPVPSERAFMTPSVFHVKPSQLKTLSIAPAIEHTKTPSGLPPRQHRSPTMVAPTVGVSSCAYGFFAATTTVAAACAAYFYVQTL